MYDMAAQNNPKTMKADKAVQLMDRYCSKMRDEVFMAQFRMNECSSYIFDIILLLFHLHSSTMSSTVQDPPDFVLLALLGEGIMSAVVEVCVYTLFYGEHFGSLCSSC